MTTGGLGISGFLKHTSDSGGGGQWLKAWRKGQKGEVTVWLHTRAPIVPTCTHSFLLEDEYQDKETKQMVPVLRYPRFVSPDPELVHRSQYFRHDDGMLKIPPDRDPFLLLREYLRGANDIALNAPIFRWTNEKDHEIIVWDRGEISGLVKRGKKNFGHSLDTRIDYLYVVVDDADVGGGPVLAREGKLLSQKMAEVIKQQQKVFGDEEGDPMRHPYAFTWVAQEATSPMNSYSAYKNERAEFSDQVWEQISSDDFPDPTPFGVPADGDMEKIRDAMERAMQVELPLDMLFSDDSDVRRELLKSAQAAKTPARASKAAQTRTTTPAQTPSLPQRSAAASKPAATAPAEQSEQKPGTPQMRRRKVEPPAKPAVEMIDCDDCHKPMEATATKCPHCGAEYEVEPDAAAQQTPAAATPAQAKSNGKPTTTAAASKPKPSTSVASTKPTTAASSKPQQSAPAAEGSNCWSCGQLLNGAALCPSCGIDQGDELPF